MRYCLPLIATILIALNACSLQVTNHVAARYAPWPEERGFAVFELPDTTQVPDAEFLGEIVISDGTALVCTYEMAVDSAKKNALRLGANAIKITAHKPPGGFSTCHRIRAQALRLPDVAPYLKEIPWSGTYRLEQRHFRADTLNRPFRAATFSYIKMQVGQVWRFGKIRAGITAVFDCTKSYFKSGNNGEEVLAHEQGHFDITELHVRKLRKRLLEYNFHFNNIQSELEKIYNEVAEDWQRMQDAYDHDVYADRSKQPGWLEKIQAELEAYKDFNRPDLVLKLAKE